MWVQFEKFSKTEHTQVTSTQIKKQDYPRPPETLSLPEASTNPFPHPSPVTPSWRGTAQISGVHTGPYCVLCLASFLGCMWAPSCCCCSHRSCILTAVCAAPPLTHGTGGGHLRAFHLELSQRKPLSPLFSLSFGDCCSHFSGRFSRNGIAGSKGTICVALVEIA